MLVMATNVPHKVSSQAHTHKVSSLALSCLHVVSKQIIDYVTSTTMCDVLIHPLF